MINPERVYHFIKLAHDTLRKAGIETPKIAVCGINPHAGENGLFGYGEEDEKVVSGVEKAQKEGIAAVVPLPVIHYSSVPSAETLTLSSQCTTTRAMDRLRF